MHTKLPVIFAVMLCGMNQEVVAKSVISDEVVSQPTYEFATTIKVTCNLYSVSGQCREYTILGDTPETMKDIKDGCTSMGGSLDEPVCSDEELLAQCTDIVRNYKKPDAIYDAFYYKGLVKGLSIGDVKRVCGDLGGEFLRSPD